jgi:rare lipoprotein A
VKARVAQRVVVIAALALLAATIALAVTSRNETTPSRTTRELPEPEGSYTALAASTGPAAYGKRTACGKVIRPETVGVAHPVLPCGVRLYISYRGKHILAQVIDRGPDVSGHQFDLTPALARRLGLGGVRKIEWSYARAG